jgi:uncharacterized membrane protein SirB2
MIAFYPQIKWLHVACVLASFALFALRGSLVLAGHEKLARHPLPRVASYAIDTVLLSAALMLVAILPGALFANHWLSVKLVLLVAYIVCGSLALGRARTARARAPWFGAAVLVFAAMFAIARSHDPLGPWRMLAG